VQLFSFFLVFFSRGSFFYVSPDVVWFLENTVNATFVDPILGKRGEICQHSTQAGLWGGKELEHQHSATGKLESREEKLAAKLYNTQAQRSSDTQHQRLWALSGRMPAKALAGYRGPTFAKVAGTCSQKPCCSMDAGCTDRIFLSSVGGQVALE